MSFRAGEGACPAIVALSRPFEDPVPSDLASEQIDLVTLMSNYHDLGHLSVDRAAMNRAVFRALKPGGALLAYPNPAPCIGSKKPFFARKSKRRASGWWRKGSSCATPMIQVIRTRQ